MMERLEPILKQKFWILLSVAIIMTLTGWYMATSTMAKDITARKAEIDTAFTKIPTGAIPNEIWAKKLNDLNASQETAIALTQAGLWKKQLEKMMIWPDGVEIQNGYWGKISNESREQFRLSYKSEVRQVWKALRPLDILDDDGTGIVNFPFENMYAVLRRPPWNVTGVDSNALWELKEDLWLLERLFQSIAAVNGGPESNRNDAYIHQIDRLELRGGGAKPQKTGTGTASGPNQPVDGGLTMVSAEFDPIEEFGDDGSSALAGPGGTSQYVPGSGLAGVQLSLGNRGGGGGGNEPAPAPATPAAKPVNRYIQKADGLPFKTRGFYLSVKMDHTKIPALISELTVNEKSVLPVEVIRVQMSRLHEDLPTGNSGGGGGAGNNQAGGALARKIRAADDDARARAGQANTENAAKAAEATLRKSLADPIMAQVTICGIFTLYQKSAVEPPPAPARTPPSIPAPTAATSSDESVQPDAAAEAADMPTTEGNNQPTASPTEASAPAEAAGGISGVPDSPAAKAVNEEK